MDFNEEIPAIKEKLDRLEKRLEALLERIEPDPSVKPPRSK